MAFTIIDESGPIISAKISGELGKSEVTQIQAVASARSARCSFSIIFAAGSASPTGATSLS